MIERQPQYDQKEKVLALLTVAENGLPHVRGYVFSFQGQLLEGEVKVHVHGLGVSDVEVAVRLRRETSPDLSGGGGSFDWLINRSTDKKKQSGVHSL